MDDPTYDRDVMQTNGAWEIAFVLSEMANDAAPIGWSRFIPIAERAIGEARELEAELRRRGPSHGEKR